MEVVVAPNPIVVAGIAAEAIERLVQRTRHPVLGLATGSSPIPIYQKLIERYRSGGLSFARSQAFLLDEYVGLPSAHPEAYISYIKRELVDHIDLPVEALQAPDGRTQGLPNAAENFEHLIAASGGIDLQLLASVPTAILASTSLHRLSGPGRG